MKQEFIFPLGVTLMTPSHPDYERAAAAFGPGDTLVFTVRHSSTTMELTIEHEGVVTVARRRDFKQDLGGLLGDVHRLRNGATLTMQGRVAGNKFKFDVDYSD